MPLFARESTFVSVLDTHSLRPMTMNYVTCNSTPRELKYQPALHRVSGVYPEYKYPKKSSSLVGLFFIYLFFWPRSMWDPSSPTRYRSHAPCIGNAEY